MQLDNLDSSFAYLLESSAKMYENVYKLDATTSAVFVGTDFISLILNVYFHYLIYRMATRKDIKNSQGTTTNLLTCYCVIVPASFLVAFTYLNIILQYTYPPSEIFGEWFCFAHEYFVHVTTIYFASFSLFTALMKYWFIVENTRAKNFGLKKGRATFLILHLTIPIIISALISISNGEESRIYLVNICWSQPISTFDTINRNISHENGAKNILCSNRRYQTSYYLGETASEYLDPLFRVICGSISIFQALFCSNISELVVYTLVYRYLNR